MSGDELMHGRPSDPELDEQLLSHLWRGHPLFPRLFLVTGLGAGLFVVAFAYTVVTGVGTWGNNIPVAWAFAITNFVWWIGIGHAGTFISAILLVTQQRWRASINRITEAMTLFAVVNAGLFPIAHLGRPWFFYWLVPYPATMGIWPQFRSSLTWDIAAIATYGTVSLLFCYLGLLPDLATARDRAPTRLRRRLYGLCALGWRGSARDWQRHRAVYVLMAGLATALVVSVHSIVSLDFSVTKLPGWHSTIFPPYFVAGALLSGFAMVLTLLIPLRAALGLGNVITARHLDNIAKVILVTGSFVGYAYLAEAYVGWRSAGTAERYLALVVHPHGPLAWAYWLSITGNALVPQIFWLRRARRSVWTLFFAALAVQVGMWCERFLVVVGSLERDRLPSGWAGYAPTVIDLALFVGSISLFAFLLLLFVRWVPPVPIAELKVLRRELEAADAERAHA